MSQTKKLIYGTWFCSLGFIYCKQIVNAKKITIIMYGKIIKGQTQYLNRETDRWWDEYRYTHIENK